MKILKFLHASNFQLHIPVTFWPSPVLDEHENQVSTPDVEQGGGLALERLESWLFGAVFPELPNTIYEECLSAIWKSAERVFDLALEQNVDFLLLTGNVLQPDLTGARGLVFLTNQFKRLQERGIPVYWKLERSIEEWMLPDFRFPENVFLFPSGETHVKKFRLADSPKNIFITSWNSRKPDFSKYDFSKLPDRELPPAQTIALCPDVETFQCVINSELKNTKNAFSFETKIQSEIPVSTVSYVALTESPERITLKKEYTKKLPSKENIQTILHAPGPIQFHSPDIWEAGKVLHSAGVTIVHQDLDGDLPISLQFYPTETLAWSFLERTIPVDVSTWESLGNWLLAVLKEEFPEDSSAESQLAERTFVYWRLNAEKPGQTLLLRQLVQESIEAMGGQAKDENQNLTLLLGKLRNFGKKLSGHPWTICLTANLEGIIPYSWEQGESMLSAFLHLCQFHLQNNLVNGKVDISLAENFVPHSMNLNEMLTDAQSATGLNVLGKLEPDENTVILKFARVLGAQAFAETQEGDRK